MRIQQKRKKKTPQRLHRLFLSSITDTVWLIVDRTALYISLHFQPTKKMIDFFHRVSEYEFFWFNWIRSVGLIYLLHAQNTTQMLQILKWILTNEKNFINFHTFEMWNS